MARSLLRRSISHPFHINAEECSAVAYGDDRGESDCLSGNVRSQLSDGGKTRVGSAVEYRFDVLVDPV